MTQYPDHARIAQTLLDQQGQINDLTAERDGAYRERAHLVALLATHYPAVIAPALDLDEAGWWIAYLTIGDRQCSWHISPRDAGLFAHVECVEPDDPRAQWDGHTTDAKYAWLRQFTAAGPAAAQAASATPCPACARADQAGLAPAELHPACRAVTDDPTVMPADAPAPDWYYPYERCAHCDQTPTADQMSEHLATVHAELPDCTARIDTDYGEAYTCAYKAGHKNGEYGEWHRSLPGATWAGAYQWNDDARGAVPHHASKEG